MTPYVLRRDKREDESVKRFDDYAGLRYRDEERQISIEVGDLSPKWQRAVFAGEALSFASRLSEDPIAKRLRLTIGSGYGIATMLDQELTDEERDKKQLDKEYSPIRGGLARFMYGGTRPETRRMIQLAFNRQRAFPKVLVAQSMVGREGLNLHKACRMRKLLSLNSACTSTAASATSRLPA